MEIHPPMLHRVQAHGFTLVEMMATMAISAILLTVVAPAFIQLVAATRITAAVNELNTSLYLMRSEAIKRGLRTTLCPSSDGVRCSGQPIWEHGWMVFADADGDRELDPGERLLLRHDSFEPSISIRSGARTYIVFQSTGMALGGTAGTYTVCDASDAAAPKALVLANTGKARVSPTKSDGRPLECP